MKKIFATMAAVVISAAVMTACGGKVPENTVHSIDDLNGKTIGVQQGTTGDTLASDIDDAKVEKYNKYADAVQSLKQGKVDAVIIDSDTASAFINKNDDIELLDEGFADEEYAIAMNLDNTALQAEINTALDELKKMAHLMLSRIITTVNPQERINSLPMRMPIQARANW